MLGALRKSPSIMLEEPVRTLTSLGAAVSKRVLPDAVFERLKAGAVKVATSVPGLRP